jgi:2-oxoglutarate ferredoxin oxidoreductase subunit gamma
MLTDLQTLTELRVRFAGIGGQGAVLLGEVLGLAGALAGLRCAGSTIYGSQARGGASQSDVIVAHAPIDFPHVLRPHVLVALAQEPYDELGGELEPPGVIIYDDFFVKHPRAALASHQHGFPATRSVIDELGLAQVANVYLLGAFAALSGVVADAALAEALRRSVPERFATANERALALGLAAARALATGGS